MPKWQTFDPPTVVKASTQLDSLLLRLRDRSAAGMAYHPTFIDMITVAQESIPYPPNEYADFLSAIIGRPLALVNTGWSLELDLNKLYAYFLAGGVVDVNAGPYPLVNPYFLTSANAGRVRQIHVVATAIIDSYTPMHGYSGSCPSNRFYLQPRPCKPH